MMLTMLIILLKVSVMLLVLLCIHCLRLLLLRVDDKYVDTTKELSIL